MGDSDIIMPPQQGNASATCAVEVLNAHSARDIWHSFAQEILDSWIDLRKLEGGHNLKIRPHWTKEWKDLTVDGRPWAQVLWDEIYNQEIKKLNVVMDKIGKQH